MPAKRQEFSLPGLNKEDILRYSFGTVLELGWKPLYAGPDALVMYTPKKWNKYEDEVIIRAEDEKMTVTSSLVHGESFDLFKKNQRHINEFITAFDKIKLSGIKPEWAASLEEMRQKTIEAVTVQAKEQEEVDKVMRQSNSNLYVTYGIIGINVIIFILMIINGAGIFEPDGSVHVQWGSNYTSLTLSGEWWRLVTNMFIHFGIIHIVMNTYALYMAGVYLEPMLGKVKYITAYLCTGVLASIASLWWHTEGVNSAGASGAIFGLYGVFLALLLTNLIPKQIRMALLQSIGIFVVFNLIYGMKSGVDNAAHIGGLVSGMVIGFLFYAELSGKIKVKKPATVIIFLLFTAAGSWYFLQNFKSDAVIVQKLIDEASSLEKSAIQSYETTNITTAADYKEKLTNITLPTWQKGLDKINGMKAHKMNDKMRQFMEKYKKYFELRIEYTRILIKAQDAEKDAYTKELEEANKKVEEVFKEDN